MKVLKSIRNILVAVLRGELLLRLKVDKVFLHIVYLLFIVWTTLFVNLKIEQTMLKVEKNRKEIETLRIYYAQKSCELATFDRIGKVHDMLKEMGSDVTLPTEPAAVIRKK